MINKYFYAAAGRWRHLLQYFLYKAHPSYSSACIFCFSAIDSIKYVLYIATLTSPISFGHFVLNPQH